MHPFFIATEGIRDAVRSARYKRSGFPRIEGNDGLHLEAVVSWLEAACRSGRGGVSSHYSLMKGGWLDPFPETTGYIIPTLYDYAAFSGEKRYAEMARGLAGWLRTVQLPDGGCMQGTYNPERPGAAAPVVFNTGQNLLGFLRAFRETGEEAFLDSARRAAGFLCASTDEAGVWNRNLLRGLQHTINSRCSWALLELHALSSEPCYLKVAWTNLDWVLRQQRENGWFEHGFSRRGELPNLHFISYTCEGLIQSNRIAPDGRYLAAAARTAGRLRDIFAERGMLYAWWDEKWRNRGRRLKWSRGRHLCLTGCIQIAIVWMWLFQETGEAGYKDAAFRMLDHIKALHDLKARLEGVRGGVKGSFPVYGAYASLKYPDWAAKFFADALLLKIKLQATGGRQ